VTWPRMGEAKAAGHPEGRGPVCVPFNSGLWHAGWTGHWGRASSRPSLQQPDLAGGNNHRLAWALGHGLR
jgi:hypothetical protein